jgi:hypothetical protein
LLEACLLVFVVRIVLASTLVSAVFFIRHRVIQPLLRTVRVLDLHCPDRLGFMLMKMIKRYTERKSAKALIIWSIVLLLFGTYGTIADALVIPARSAVVLSVTVVPRLATLCYGALRVFKLGAQGSGRR